MTYLFLDTNVYLSFYSGDKLYKILEALVKNKQSILIPQQILDEIFRNSASVTARTFTDTVKSTGWKRPLLPHNIATEETSKSIEEITNKVRALQSKIQLELDNHFDLVAKLEDEVSKKILELQDVALQPSKDEIERAESLKKFGQPPGKPNDPIGDELNWVQVLGKMKEGDTIVIVTTDGDYTNTFNKNIVLNPVLRNTLVNKKVNYFVFDEVNAGFKKFTELQKAVGAPIPEEDIPTKEEYIEIEKEEQKLNTVRKIADCPHSRRTIIQNGIFDDWICLDCNKLIYRQYGEFD